MSGKKTRRKPTRAAQPSDTPALLAMLRAAGVRRFRNGDLEVEFEPLPPSLPQLRTLEELTAELMAPSKRDDAPKTVYDDEDLWAATPGGRAPEFPGDDEAKA